ncbi:COG4 transporter [Diplocarpon rosae]|nr:COG4 transporter [Diplocarpon rosae]
MPPPGLTNGNSSAIPLFDDSTAPASIYDSASIAAIRASLRDAAITSQLQSLISSQADLSRELGRLDLLRAHLGTQVIHTRDISNGMLDPAAGTATHLSSKVKELDLEKKRVEETLGVVEQVAELKACVQGVVGSMGAPQDWEAAAGYIARASKIPAYIVEGNFAASIVPSVEVPDVPGVTIENAKESLCGLFLREFEKAADEGDGSKITRFFKLFPLIGREDTGLEVYGRYVCQGVAARARGSLREGTKGSAGQDGFFYANALTRLFEHIAQIVDGHGGLVERHYGKGKMVKVIERLQVEADVQGGIVLDMWSDERGVDRRLTDVKSYPFSFLVHSFLPTQKNMGISRTTSPAVGGGTNGRVSEDEGVDMKEIDGLLNETAMMLGRWSMYSRFLAGKCRVSPSRAVLLQAISKISQDPGDSPEEPLSMPDLLLKSALGRKISSRLITPFNIMTTFFFRRSVEKAFQLDESPTGLTRVLGSDFIGMIQRKMRDESYPKAVVQGGYAPEDKIIAFIVLINSLDLATDYISRIVSSRLSPAELPTGAKGINPLNEMFPFGHDAIFVKNALENLQGSFASKSSELITDGVQVMFERVVKPRLRPVLSESFRDVDYSLDEEDMAELLRNNDPEEDSDLLSDLVARRFEHGWEALMKPIQRIMTPKSFASLLDVTAKYLSRVLEKRVWGFSGKINALGAQRMERDFSGIIGAIARGGRYGVRDSFARVAQITMLVNMEEEEWEAINEAEEAGDEEMTWRFSLLDAVSTNAEIFKTMAPETLFKPSNS